jgi:hypothetical protein
MKTSSIIAKLDPPCNVLARFLPCRVNGPVDHEDYERLRNIEPRLVREYTRPGVGSFSAQRTPDCAAGGSCRGSQAGAARFPGVLLSRGPLRACCYRSGSAAAARSRATDPAATRAHPAAILGLRRCTARATQGT